MRVRPDQWAPGSAGFRIVQSLIACAGLLLAPDSSYAQLNPLIDSLYRFAARHIQELNTLCPPTLPTPKVVQQRKGILWRERYKAFRQDR